MRLLEFANGDVWEVSGNVIVGVSKSDDKKILLGAIVRETDPVVKLTTIGYGDVLWSVPVKK